MTDQWEKKATDLPNRLLSHRHTAAGILLLFHRYILASDPGSRSIPVVFTSAFLKLGAIRLERSLLELEPFPPRNRFCSLKVPLVTFTLQRSKNLLRFCGGIRCVILSLRKFAGNEVKMVKFANSENNKFSKRFCRERIEGTIQNPKNKVLFQPINLSICRLNEYLRAIHEQIQRIYLSMKLIENAVAAPSSLSTTFLTTKLCHRWRTCFPIISNTFRISSRSSISTIVDGLVSSTNLIQFEA